MLTGAQTTNHTYYTYSQTYIHTYTAVMTANTQKPGCSCMPIHANAKLRYLKAEQDVTHEVFLYSSSVPSSTKK